jgi:hypothetical protein
MTRRIEQVIDSDGVPSIDDHKELRRLKTWEKERNEKKKKPEKWRETTPLLLVMEAAGEANIGTDHHETRP